MARYNGIPKQTRKLLEAAEAAGWQVIRTKRGHFRLVPSDQAQPIIVVGGTPSDHRAIRNFRSLLRRAGLPA